MSVSSHYFKLKNNIIQTYSDPTLDNPFVLQWLMQSQTGNNALFGTLAEPQSKTTFGTTELSLSYHIYHKTNHDLYMTGFVGDNFCSNRCSAQNISAEIGYRYVVWDNYFVNIAGRTRGTRFYLNHFLTIGDTIILLGMGKFFE